MKTVFKNKTFFYVLLGYISFLLLYNIFLGITTKNYWGLLPIIIQVILLALMLTYNKYARIALIWWTIIFHIIDFSLTLMGSLLSLVGDAHKGAPINKIIFSSVMLIIGITILTFLYKTVKVEWPARNSFQNSVDTLTSENG
jgi:hypothetical protein